jgi:hypothetical protein
MKLNPGLPWQKLHSRKEGSFHQEIGLKFEETTSETVHWGIALYDVLPKNSGNLNSALNRLPYALLLLHVASSMLCESVCQQLSS